MASIFSIHQDNLNPLAMQLIHGVLLEAVQDEEIQAEGWRTCTVITKFYFSESIWDILQNHFIISAASLKFAEAYASVMGINVTWWQWMMENYLQPASSNDMGSVRAATCDCFASMSSVIYEKLAVSRLSFFSLYTNIFFCVFQVRYQRLAVTLLFSMCSDTDAHVRAAACRALGVFVLFPSLREDPMFVSDMTKSVLLQKDDKTILVRVRVSWAIANLCDGLVLESEEKAEFSLREFMSTTEWIEVLSTATHGALDNEKVK